MTTDPPPPVPFDLEAELARIDGVRERLRALAGDPASGPVRPLLFGGVVGAGFFAAGMAFQHFVLH